MTDPGAEREADRVRRAYARRAELGLDARYEYWHPANLFIYQARERAVLSLLRRSRLLPLTGRRVLDVGCGDGSVLRDLQRYGSREADLYGIDLLTDRVDRARDLMPRAHIDTGDASSLPFEDEYFDLTLGFTLLSSVVDTEVRQRVASEMARVTRPGGVVLLYDFWTNPSNPDVRPLKRSEVRLLFGQDGSGRRRIDFEGTTLAPPIVRRLIGLPSGRLACTSLGMLPFLQTHFVAAVHI
jgi:SAM-dependent methyltransferase